MAKKRKVEIKQWDPNSVEDLHKYFFLMPHWYNSENLRITSRDFPYVVSELMDKFPGVEERHIVHLVKYYKSRHVTGIYKEADPEAGKEFEE